MKKMTRSLLIFLFYGLLSLCSPILNAATDSSPMGSMTEMLARVGFYLLLTLGLILGLAWVSKKTRLGGFSGTKDMQVVSSLPLGTKEKAILVKVAGKNLLLGVAPGRVSTLHVFDDLVLDNDEHKMAESLKSTDQNEALETLNPPINKLKKTDNFAHYMSRIIKDGFANDTK